MEKIIGKISLFFKWLVLTNYGRLVLAFIWTAIFIGIHNNIRGNWAFWVGMVGVLYIAVMFLIMMAYAWVINPIRDYKEMKKAREEFEANKDK